MRKRSRPDEGARRSVCVAAVAAALAASGCGGASVGASSSEEAGAASAVDIEKAKRARAIEETFAGFGFEDCTTDPSLCADEFARRAGADLHAPTGYSPRATLAKNPDPTWLPEWDRMPASTPRAPYAWRALTLAAVNKSYAARCNEAYERFAKEQSRLEKGLGHGIAKVNREVNPYDRLAMMLALEPAKAPTSGKLGEFAPGSDALRYQWEVAVFDAFEDTQRTFLYLATGHAPSEDLLGTMRPRQAPDYERDAYCIDAMRGLVPGVPAMPDLGSAFDEVRGMVKAVVPEERVASIEKRREDLTSVVRAKFQKTRVKNPSLPPGVRVLTMARVEMFERDGRAAKVRVTVTDESVRVEPNGQRKTVKVDETATASFADWPSGLVLEPGDTITFFGAESSEKITIIKSTPELEHKSRQTVLEAKHLWKAHTKTGSTVWFREG
jgi:hypothetical protein